MPRTESASIVMIIRVSGRPLKSGYGRPRYLPEISSMLCAPPSVVVAHREVAPGVAGIDDVHRHVRVTGDVPRLLRLDGARC
jgi:hypothetical protein